MSPDPNLCKKCYAWHNETRMEEKYNVGMHEKRKKEKRW